MDGLAWLQDSILLVEKLNRVPQGNKQAWREELTRMSFFFFRGFWFDVVVFEHH